MARVQYSQGMPMRVRSRATETVYEPRRQEVTQIETEQAFATQTFTITDPRTFDGDPYEVAERAMRQAHGVSVILDEMLDAAYRMARNAEMERSFANHEDPKGSEFDSTPLGKRLRKTMTDVTDFRNTLRSLAIAAGYNPRAKVPKEQ